MTIVGLAPCLAMLTMQLWEVSPLDEKRHSVDSKQLQDESMKSKATVLIVDDSKLARIVAAKAIAALQPEWEKVEATNADQALELARSQNVQAIVIDYNMPGKNGIELGQELRALYPSLPIAIITANVQDEIIAAARAIGATFVGKPVTADGLRDFVARIEDSLRGGK
jgi:CheY-like chemotaxis protein